MASSKGRIYPVFVDNIHYEAETKDLRKVFQRIGHVQEVTILSHHGFVAFADPQDAVESIRKLDGYKFFGRRIKVEATEELDDYLRQRRKYIEEEHLRRKSVEQHDRRDRCHRSKYRSQSEDHRLSTKRKITLSQKQDLRQVLNKRNKIESDSEFSDKQRTRITDDNASDISEISEENEESDKESEKDYKQANKLPKGMQELYIGNLVSPVDKSDLEQLLDGYGAVKSVKIVEDHALVRIACDADTAQDAIDTLDQSEWMDNNIHVKFSVKSDIIKKEKDKYEIWLWSDSLSRDSFLEDMCDLLSDYGEVIDRTWRPDLDSLSFEIKASEDQILDCVRHLNTFHQYKDGKIRAKFVDDSEQEAKLSKEIEDYPYQLIPDSHLPSTSSSSKSPPDKKIKDREIWLWTPAAFKKTFLKDMETMVEPFGKVKDKGWKNDHIYITLESSEKQACRCIAEVHGSSYKNAQVRAKFADNTPEDDLFKEPLYSILLRKYDKILIPNDLQVQASTSSKIIMAFNKQTLNKSPSLEMPMIKKSSTKKAVEGPSYKIVYDSAILENVEGRVYSMSSKLILISFHVGNAGQSLRFARLKPGHMHINGRNNFGYIVKDFRYADWPESIREVFKLEQSVMMDLRQLSQPEKEEMRNLTHENVMYDVSLLWKSQKPENLIRKLNKPTYKATVIKLWPKWAILQPVMVYGDQALILMLREEFYTPEDPDKNQSLLNHIEIGDTLAILAAPTDYLAMAEKARSLDYFNEPTNNLKYQTILGWPLKSEIDPYAILGKEKKVDVSEVEFFASAVNLNFALPSEREATFKKLKGVIDEIHVPSGGIISLKDSQDKNQADQKVYFHRSRLFVNGVKLASNAVLEDEISVGDPVQIDITKNQFDLTSTYVSGTDAFWVGLSVKVSTVDRGQTIANKLRAEVKLNLNCTRQVFLRMKIYFFFGLFQAIDPSAYANKLCQGRIVYLKPSEHDIVNAGIAVIDSGPYAGQRLEFEADQCYLFGYCLQSADLSYLFNKSKKNKKDNFFSGNQSCQ